mgnify:CR=1 FL=1
MERFKYDNHINMNMKFEVTKMGERGQIVIPQEFREQLKLEKGEKFVVIESDGILMLQRLDITRKDFDGILKKTHEFAKQHKLTEKDMWDAIKKTREKR